MGMTPSKRTAQNAFLLVGTALLVFTAVCYVGEPDACAAVTVWPPWAWAVPGLVLSLIGTRRRGTVWMLAVTAAWLVYVVVLCEEPAGLLRAVTASPRAPRQRAIRVVSLNCAGGSAAAANEVIRYHPDIVLLQESPSRRQLSALAHRLFGDRASLVWGTDCSIMVRGRLGAGRDLGCATQAYANLGNGLNLNLVSLRLSPPVARSDIWSPSCWRAQAELRRTHRQELRAVIGRLMLSGVAMPIIVGGDFNAPGWDGALKESSGWLVDTFRERGVGYCNTVLNDCPVLRFDQVWVSRTFKVLSVRAYKTKHSDHRMVVCDLETR